MIIFKFIRIWRVKIIW